jgi:phosphatidylserine/phosphatidylglycerophosphate/cardiolipin synthase-like enzyme
VSSANINVRIGRGFRDLVEEIQSARKRVWVMSPWISPEYAQLLVRKASEGVDVRVFTTDDLGNRSHVSGLMELIEARRVVIRPASPLARRLGFVLFLLGLVAVFIVLPAGVLMMIAGAAIYLMWGRDKFGIRYFSKVGEGRLVIYHSEPLNMVHAKIYVVDDHAAVGSVNFTRSGVESNFECLVKIRDPLVVEEIVNRLGSLGNDPELREVPVDKIGWEILPVEEKSRIMGLIESLFKR